MRGTKGNARRFVQFKRALHTLAPEGGLGRHKVPGSSKMLDLADGAQTLNGGEKLQQRSAADSRIRHAVSRRKDGSQSSQSPAGRVQIDRPAVSRILATVMVTVETYVAAAEVMIPVVAPEIFLDYCGRSPISGGPNAVGRAVAVNPGVARSGARGARGHDRRGGAESDSDANVWSGEESASQKHHHCDRLFHFLALLAPYELHECCPNVSA